VGGTMTEKEEWGLDFSLEKYWKQVLAISALGIFIVFMVIGIVLFVILIQANSALSVVSNIGELSDDFAKVSLISEQLVGVMEEYSPKIDDYLDKFEHYMVLVDEGDPFILARNVTESLRRIADCQCGVRTRYYEFDGAEWTPISQT
jgi:hypothetical protein